MSRDSQLAGSAVGPTLDPPIQLLAGDGGVLVTDGAPLAPTTTLLQYTVIAKNAAGQIVAWAPAASDVTNKAIGILAQDASSDPANTAAGGVAPNYCPYFKGGKFNHLALIWPGSVTTLAARMAAFEGTPVHISHILK